MSMLPSLAQRSHRRDVHATSRPPRRQQVPRPNSLIASSAAGTVTTAEATAWVQPPCQECNGVGRTTCPHCGGSGRLKHGYNRNNRVDLSRIVSSKWTAMQTTLGWRHFRVQQIRRGKQSGAPAFVLMQASCDLEAQLWVNSVLLKDRSKWAGGWLQLSALQQQEGDGTAGEGSSSSPIAEADAGSGQCRLCSGKGTTPCASCDGSGIRVIDI